LIIDDTQKVYSRIEILYGKDFLYIILRYTYFIIYYLVPTGVMKFAGKLSAELVQLIESVVREVSDWQINDRVQKIGIRPAFICIFNNSVIA